MSETLGTKLRRRRRRLGFTLDELAVRTSISKPYLSLIETGRVANPPSDEKLRRLEQTLGFGNGELLGQAHLQRTPPDVRIMLQKLMQGRMSFVQRPGQAEPGSSPINAGSSATSLLSSVPAENNLDDAYMTGVLQELTDQSSPNVQAIGAAATAIAVPVINRVSAGYPKDFTDLSYPKGVADEYVGCPDVASDQDAFAARVHGDSMQPKYREGDIVIFSPAAAPKNGDDCFVRFETGQTTFKRAFFENDEKGAAIIRLQPRNEKYRPQIIPADQVSGLYKALYRYERVD